MKMGDLFPASSLLSVVVLLCALSCGASVIFNEPVEQCKGAQVRNGTETTLKGDQCRRGLVYLVCGKEPNNINIRVLEAVDFRAASASASTKM